MTIVEKDRSEYQAAPDHDHTCATCGQSPVFQLATTNKDGRATVVYNSGICGACYFGCAEMVHPENW